MSRIGQQIINLPKGVQVTVAVDGAFSISGPLGTLKRVVPPSLQVELADHKLTVKPVQGGRRGSASNAAIAALWGTYGSHLKNMVEGVSHGFTKDLVIEGIGYKALLNGQKITFNLGWSHPYDLPVPAGLKIKIDKNNLQVSGADKELVTGFAAKIRSLKPPEPYKGKGIRYADEVLRRKAGKKVTTTA